LKEIMTEPDTKRLKVSSCISPSSFVTWNCNGFVSRCKYNLQEIQRLVQENDFPDCLCLQEVRLKALNSTERDKMQKGEHELIRHVFTKGGPFSDYEAYWSLADKRYAGTLTLLHKRLGFDRRETATAFDKDSAIRLMLKIYGLTRKEAGLPEEIIENSSSLSSKKKQTSISSFFSPKHKKTFLDGATKQTSSGHNAEGRFQFFSFEDMDIIQTYVPNNGMKEESFQRRKEWDQEMNNFLQSRLKILRVCGKETRALLWCGDLNCARDYRDGTHWERRLESNNVSDKNSACYEWWTDESKCFMSTPEKDRRPENRGMPSFTPAERARLSQMMQTGNLIDVWREFYPNGNNNEDNGPFKSVWDRPNWTWRAHLSKNGNSRYEGRGQRLDYFLLSRSSDLKPVKCEILGYDSQRKGLFCGSDHCALVLLLRRNEKG